MSARASVCVCVRVCVGVWIRASGTKGLIPLIADKAALPAGAAHMDKHKTAKTVLTARRYAATLQSPGKAT